MKTNQLHHTNQTVTTAALDAFTSLLDAPCVVTENTLRPGSRIRLVAWGSFTDPENLGREARFGLTVGDDTICGINFEQMRDTWRYEATLVVVGNNVAVQAIAYNGNAQRVDVSNHTLALNLGAALPLDLTANVGEAQTASAVVTCEAAIVEVDV